MTDRTRKLEDAFQALKQALKNASIEALEQDAFATSRDLAGIMEQLAGLQTRSLGLLRSKTGSSPNTDIQRTIDDETFPRFFRADGILYKEGLRQDGESVYIQKVDRRAFEEIFQSILEQKRKFKPASLIKNIDHPSYQVYILLHVMQEAGLVENPERGIYRLTPKAKEFEPAGFWEAIEERVAH